MNAAMLELRHPVSWLDAEALCLDLYWLSTMACAVVGESSSGCYLRFLGKKKCMKNYFSWKRLGSFGVMSSSNEQPLVQGAVAGPQLSSCAVTLLERDNLADVQHRASTEIAVCTPQQETLNAVLLCSFAVPAAGMNYLAYSLNESIGDQDVRVYIAALQFEQGRYRLAMSVADHAWQQAFSQIVDQDQMAQDARWHYIDIGQQPLPVALCEEHASIKLNKTLVMGLLLRPDAVEVGQAIEYAPVASTYRNEPVNQAADAVQETSQPAEQLDGQDEELDEVQENLSNLVALAQELEQRHSLSTQQHRQLEERQSQLLEKERELNSKVKDLASRYAALRDAEAQAASLQTRLQLLSEREAELKVRSEELALGQQKLLANRARFSGIVKKFNAAVQLKGTGLNT